MASALLSPHLRLSLLSSSSSSPSSITKFRCLSAIKAASKMEGAEILEEEVKNNVSPQVEIKKVFVAGATGGTGRRIVEMLLAKGFQVKAGVRDMEKAKATFSENPALQFVRADVTEGEAKLVEAIGKDVEAVICATGGGISWDLLSPWKVDNLGTVNLVEACSRIGIKRFILISSLLVNGAAMGQFLNPAYIFLNVFGLTLIAKLQAEKHIRKCGINYTIIRPGGLRNDPPSGNIVMEPEDTLYKGSISRDQVAEVAVEALIHPESSYKVVEIVSSSDAPNRSLKDLFGSIRQN